ncbi:MAG: MATE family efflux transporter [Burkholderiales bacterium]|nr:MATE family efflux transporter [Phycisphaerae bacterium]
MSLPTELIRPKSVSPLRELLVLAVPTVLQMGAYTLEQFIDAWMLASVSDLPATACVNAGMLAFCVLSFGFGIMMLINAMVSHSFGAGRLDDCGVYLWQGIWIGLAYSVAVVPLTFIARPAFTLAGHSAELVPMEVTYFNISVALIAVKMLAMAVGQFMLAINHPNLVLLAASAGLVANVIVNWFLIYGNAGFPAMGVAGAAWGTNAAVLTELLIVAWVVFGPGVRRKYNTLAWRVDWAKFKEVLKTGIPSGFQMTGDVFAWTLFLAAVMALYGNAAMAANTYMIQYMKLSFMPAFGIGTAVTALVARYLGAGDPEASEQSAHLGFKVAAAYMLMCGVLFFVFRNSLIGLFTNDPEIIRLGGLLLIFSAIFQFFDAMFIVYIGALRGVRDTFWPTTVQLILCWTLVVGGGYLVARFWRDAGIGGPWTVACVYGMILGFYLRARFKSGKWKKNEKETGDSRSEIGKPQELTTPVS